MSIDIKAEVKFSFAQEGEYLVRLQDADRTVIGKVFEFDGEWRAYTTKGQPTGRGNTRYLASRSLLEAYELANGLRDSEGRRVTKDLETGLWYVAEFTGVRRSSRWADKADAIAYLASLQPVDFEQVGRQAARNDEPAAPGVNADVRWALAGRPVGDPENIRIMEAFSKGYQSVRDEEAQAALADLTADEPVDPTAELAERLFAKVHPQIPATGDDLGLPESVTVFGKVFTEPGDIKAFWSAWTDEERATYAAAQQREIPAPANTITNQDIREHVVEPLLGEFAADYDIDAIMADLFARWPLSEWTYADLRYDHPKFDSEQFNEILQRHDRSPKVEVTPVLVWGDGTVTGGVKELTDRMTGQAYGHDTEEFALYVTQGGALHRATTRQLSQRTDEDLWIHEVYGVYAGDADEPVLTVHLHIDGRA
ncbi:MAG TPA: hypothetical protein VMT27_01570 [Actinomycetes bacterium]|nr:hypothetical protein [Actinomycetes bacterium]